VRRQCRDRRARMDAGAVVPQFHRHQRGRRLPIDQFAAVTPPAGMNSENG
jgi:hypothetical protein